MSGGVRVVNPKGQFSRLKKNLCHLHRASRISSDRSQSPERAFGGGVELQLLARRLESRSTSVATSDEVPLGLRVSAARRSFRFAAEKIGSFYMTLAELLENRFRADTRFRGASFISDDCVTVAHVTSAEIQVTVEDDREFEILIRRPDSPGDLEFECSCRQFDRSGVCKHIWGAVLAADRAGYVDPASRPGNILPFRAPDRSPALGGFSVDDLFDDDLPAGVLPSRGTATAVELPRWEEQLLALRDRLQTQAPAEPAAVRERRIFYEIDIEASWNAGQVVLQVSQQQRRAAGDWGKVKPLRISQERLTQIESREDRYFLSLLTGGLPERTAWQQRQQQSSGAAHRFTVPFELATQLLPRMCAGGKLRFSDEPDTALVWEDGPPWELSLVVAPTPENENYWLCARIVRDGVELPQEDLRLMVAGGFVFTPQAVTPLDDFGAFEWMRLINSDEGFEVPRTAGTELVDRLYSMPAVPRVDLPEELSLEEVTADPVPVLTLFMPNGPAWRREHVTAEVGFEYLGTIVRAASRQHTIVQTDDRRSIPRNREAEQARMPDLESAGFRMLTDHGLGRDVEIRTQELGTAVRALVDAGWHVRADGHAVQQAGKVKFKVKSDIDWFDIEADVDFDGRSVAFPKLLAALKRGDTAVRLDDGSLGILPEEWLAQIGLLSGLGSRNEEGLRFSNNQAAILDALLAGQESVDYDGRFLELRERLRGFDGVTAEAEPDGFVGELREYQKMGLGWLNFLRDFRFGGCLADDMGLGKTVQVLASLAAHHLADPSLPPTLVVVPRSLIFNWHQECERFAPKLTVLEYTGPDRDTLRPTLSEHNVILTTYGTLRRDAIALRDQPFEYVILDEAQTIKNPTSQVARAARVLNAQHRIALTGTPIENSLGDLWSIFEFLNPGMLGRSKAFREHTSNPEDRESRVMLSRGLRPFILRRSKQQVAAELPEKLEETIYCEMEGSQRELYEELRLHYRDALLGVVAEEGINKSRMHVLEALLRLRQAACHPALLDRDSAENGSAKVDYLVPMLEELIAEGHKALVFSQFTSMLSIVRGHLDKKGVVYEYLDGRTRNRKDIVERFQNDPDCPVFLISLKAGGLGLNLTAADYVFLLDPWWNPAVEAQAVDRAHRVGQQRPVFAYRLICRDTVEEKIAMLQRQKRDLADAILEADNSGVLKDLSVEDLEMLLS